MRIAVILNGLSRKKRFFYSRLLPVISENHEAKVFETQSSTDAFTFSAQAVSEKYDLIIAAGGDGTINQVLNGMLSSGASKDELPALSILPAGSGNDFARTVKITLSVKALKQRLETFNLGFMDVGLVTYQSNSKEANTYFLNVASAGMGPEVLNKMASGKKTLGPAFAYYSAILQTFLTYRCMRVSIKTPEWNWSNKLRTLAIGNGKFFGSGLAIAPDAQPNDRIFSAFVCGNVSVLDFIRYTEKLKSSKKINHPKISYRTAQTLELTSETPCRIEADGELLGFLPARIEVLPARIRFL